VSVPAYKELRQRITISLDGGYAAVSNGASDDCSIIAHLRREIARIKVGKGPKRLLVVRVQ